MPPKSGGGERRSHKRRLGIEGRVAFSPGGHSARIQDLSPEGMRFLYDSKEGLPPAGSFVTGTVRVERPVPRSFTFVGRVAWERRDEPSGTTLSGVYFRSVEFRT